MTAEVDWSDAASVIEYLVASVRVLAGPKRPFDERAARAFVGRDIERATTAACRRSRCGTAGLHARERAGGRSAASADRGRKRPEDRERRAVRRLDGADGGGRANLSFISGLTREGQALFDNSPGGSASVSTFRARETVFLSPAGTISIFCGAVQLRYFLCSLNLAVLSVERRILSRRFNPPTCQRGSRERRNGAPVLPVSG